MSHNTPEKICSSNGELHLILLWEKARQQEKEILGDIEKHLKIIECYDILWSKEHVASNFTRLYGLRLDNSSAKEKECGSGRFLLLTVWDAEPKYEFVETARGHEYVNINLFKLKEKYCQWTNDGHKIHTTYTPAETNHDITLLLGISYCDYIARKKSIWNGEYIFLNTDLAGANGWKDFNELFYVLNNTTNYLILRNHNDILCNFNTKLHENINILTDDYQNTALILNASKADKDQNSVHYVNTVDGKKIHWDIRYVGDNYYCESWQRNILASKVKNEDGLFIADAANYLYTLIYHVLIHKKKFTPDYYAKAKANLEKLATNVSIDDGEFTHVFDAYYKVLKKFMAKQRYVFVKPNDSAVYYNKRLIDTDSIIYYLEQKYCLAKVDPIMINRYGGSGYIYFQAYSGKDKLFVKWNGLGDTCKNEFKYGKACYDENQINFLAPKYYRYDGDKKFVAMHYIDGESLETLIEKDALSTEQRISVLQQLHSIATTLLKTGYVHRDIRPGNFMLTSDNKLVLIDFQFAVDSKNYQESKVVQELPTLISGLGTEYAWGKYKWDDLYSLHKLAVLIDTNKLCPEIINSLHSKIGKLTICMRNRKWILFRKKTLKFLACFMPTKKLRKKIRAL